MPTAQPTMAPSPDPVVIFDRAPPRRTHFCLTFGRPYQTCLVDQDLRLYEITDDRGQRMRISLYGRTYMNGGYWHLQADEALLNA